jgi:hypothetical protein
MLNPIEFSFSKIQTIVRNRLAEEYIGGFTDLISESVNACNSAVWKVNIGMLKEIILMRLKKRILIKLLVISYIISVE